MYKIIVPFLVLLMMIVAHGAASAQEQKEVKKGMLVRISEIEIFPEFLEEYKAILIEEAEASVRLEKGVVSIFPMFEKENPLQV